MLPITVCLPVCNDKNNLKISLEAIHGHVAQILVLDFGSEDGSYQQAQFFGCQWLPCTWENHGGRVRALARTQAQQPWILWLYPGEVPQVQAWSQLESILPTTQQSSLEWVCHSPVEVICEPRLFQTQEAEEDQAIYFPLFRDRLDVPEYQLLQLKTESICWFQRSEVRAALLKAALATNPTEPRLQLLAGIRAFEAQRDAEAQQIFEALLQPVSEPLRFSQLAARVFLLKTLWEQGFKNEALEHLERFRRQFPALEHLPSLWILRGVMARHVGQKELARACFHEALTQARQESVYRWNPLIQTADLSWKPWLGLGDLYMEEGLYTQAFHAYGEVRKTLPAHPYVAAQFVRAAFLTAQYAALKPVLAEFSDLPGFTPIMRQALQQLSTYHLHGEWSNASAATLAHALLTELKQEDQQALTQAANPLLLSLVLEFALQLLRQGQPLESRPLLQYLTLRMPDHAILWHNLAYTFFAEQQYQEAETYYRQALHVQSDFIESWMDLGKVLVMQGKIQAACDAFEQILHHQPHHSLALKALAQLQGEPLPRESHTATPAVASLSESQAPFVFLFPLAPTWENGIDIALKAYFEEFVAGDHVLFVIPQAESTSVLERARAWAEQVYTPDLLPPVLLLEQPLPLLPEQTCLVLPFRLDPEPALWAQLRQAPCLTLYPGGAMADLASGALPRHLHTERNSVQSETIARVWWEVEPQVLKNRMRLALEGLLEKPQATDSSSWTTHTLRTFEVSTPQALAFHVASGPPVGPKVQLSVCMIVKNEARYLRSCLESFIADADEVIIVDTGSQDETLEIARSFEKVQVFEAIWQDDFAVARNAAIARARCPWILMLDADEFLPEGFIPSVRQYLQFPDPTVDAYVFRVEAIDEDGNVVPEKSLLVPRLFPNQPEYRFRGRIHELLTHRDKPQLNYLYIQGLPIYHRGYQERVRQERQKHARDTALMQQMIIEQPNTPETERMYLILGRSAEQTGDYTQALQYYRLGLDRVNRNSAIYTCLQKAVWRVELKQGNPELVFQAIQLEYCQDPEALMLWAEAAALMGLSAEAVKGYELALIVSDRLALKPDILGSRPARSEILKALVTCYMQHGPLSTALYFAARLVKENPQQAEYWHTYRQILRQVSLTQ